jgi:hypothetical protein
MKTQQTALKEHTYVRSVPATAGQYLFLPFGSKKWRIVNVVGGSVPGDYLNVKGVAVEAMTGDWQLIPMAVEAAVPFMSAPTAATGVPVD